LRASCGRPGLPRVCGAPRANRTFQARSGRWTRSTPAVQLHLPPAIRRRWPAPRCGVMRPQRPPGFVRRSSGARCGNSKPRRTAEASGGARLPVDDAAGRPGSHTPTIPLLTRFTSPAPRLDSEPTRPSGRCPLSPVPVGTARLGVVVTADVPHQPRRRRRAPAGRPPAVRRVEASCQSPVGEWLTGAGPAPAAWDRA
jgi:hypothetical protein